MLCTKCQSHLKSFEDFITTATDCKWLVVLIIDDFTVIHTKRRPEEEKLSEAKKVCTIVVEVFKDIQAVPVMHALCIHDQNGIDIESGIQLSTAALSMHGISESYASLMPDWLTKAFFNPEIERQNESTFINTVTVKMYERCAKWMICTHKVL